MKKSDYLTFTENINSKLENLEKLITLSLLNTVMDSIENKEMDIESTYKIKNDVKKIISEDGFVQIKIEPFGSKMVIYLKKDQKFGIKDMRNLLYKLESFDEYIVVFMLDKVNGNQRKKLLEEKISYVIEGHEMFITE